MNNFMSVIITNLLIDSLHSVYNSVLLPHIYCEIGHLH